MTGIRGALLAAIVFVLTCVPVPSHAAPNIGRWESNTIQVYSSAPTSWGVGKAVTHWNKNGAVILELVAQPCERCITIAEEEATHTDYGVVMGLAAPFTEDPAGRVFMACHISLHPAWRESHRAHMITAHEMGHCLGLGHNNLRYSILSEEWGTVFDRPTGRDLARLARLYG